MCVRTIAPQTWVPEGWVLTSGACSPAQDWVAGPLRPLLGLGVTMADLLKKGRVEEARKDVGRI